MRPNTERASRAPRKGQKTRSAYKKWQGQSDKFAREAPSYNVGRTRRMA